MTTANSWVAGVKSSRRVGVRPTGVLAGALLVTATLVALVVAGWGIKEFSILWGAAAVVSLAGVLTLTLRGFPLFAILTAVAGAVVWGAATRTWLPESWFDLVGLLKFIGINLAFDVPLVGGFLSALVLDARRLSRASIEEAVSGRRWWGEPDDHLPRLKELEALPSARFFALGEGGCTHLVVAGRRVALFLPTVWPHGEFTMDTAGQVLRGGRLFVPGSEDVDGLAAEVHTWREQLAKVGAAVRGYLVVAPPRGDATTDLAISVAPGEHLQLVHAHEMAEAAGRWLAAEPYRVDIAVMERLLKIASGSQLPEPSPLARTFAREAATQPASRAALPTDAAFAAAAGETEDVADERKSPVRGRLGRLTRGADPRTRDESGSIPADGASALEAADRDSVASGSADSGESRSTRELVGAWDSDSASRLAAWAADDPPPTEMPRAGRRARHEAPEDDLSSPVSSWSSPPADRLNTGEFVVPAVPGEPSRWSNAGDGFPVMYETGTWPASSPETTPSSRWEPRADPAESVPRAGRRRARSDEDEPPATPLSTGSFGYSTPAPPPIVPAGATTSGSPDTQPSSPPPAAVRPAARPVVPPPAVARPSVPPPAARPVVPPSSAAPPPSSAAPPPAGRPSWSGGLFDEVVPDLVAEPFELRRSWEPDPAARSARRRERTQPAEPRPSSGGPAQAVPDASSSGPPVRDLPVRDLPVTPPPPVDEGPAWWEPEAAKPVRDPKPAESGGKRSRWGRAKSSDKPDKPDKPDKQELAEPVTVGKATEATTRWDRFGSAAGPDETSSRSSGPRPDESVGRRGGTGSAARSDEPAGRWDSPGSVEQAGTSTSRWDRLGAAEGGDDRTFRRDSSAAGREVGTERPAWATESTSSYESDPSGEFAPGRRSSPDPEDRPGDSGDRGSLPARRQRDFNFDDDVKPLELNLDEEPRNKEGRGRRFLRRK
ncbi:hypothetical protein Drose_07650 [Dactylosporangium roseum]|uniref:NERD domain-containing protein n=1 Tax=Dactylosporangium roseum TaxID=47989 RepID=A0ABY5Z7R5_9ACTN|nr:hypothetical protein [Dactylosporangium roseum]UWZ38120.1 hypothetical protein Drose_07650 [Dactylosporangium roseum]